MKRLRSSDDLNSFGEKGVFKDWGRRDEESSMSRSSSHRSFHYKPENGRKGVSSFPSRYDRLDDDRESSRVVRKRSEYDSEGYDRRMSYDRYRDGSDRGILSSSPRSGYSGDRIHRSESFSAPKREIPKGFRSERDRSRREGSVSSWRRFGTGKDINEGTRAFGDSVGGSKVVSEDKGNLKFQQKPKEGKSPPCSKDSGSEQSKSSKMTKTDDVRPESGSSSEMEEGELEPEPEASVGTEPQVGGHSPTGLNPGQRKLESEEQVDIKMLNNEAKYVSSVELSKYGIGSEKRANGVKSLSELKFNNDGLRDEKLKFESDKSVEDLVMAVDKSPNNHRNSAEGIAANEETTVDIGGSNEEKKQRENRSLEEEGSKDDTDEESMPLKEVHVGDTSMPLKVVHGDTDINHEIKVGNTGLPESYKEVCEGSKVPEVVSVLVDGISHSFKDKGKNVVVVPSDACDSAEGGTEAIRESNDPLTSEDNDMEGPSTRGLDLFRNHPVKQPEKILSGLNKPKDEKLELEPLDLSLGLPNVLLPIDSQNRAPTPGSPTHVRSVQSFPSTFLTNSDGFSASMSFSGSQPFRHNPSCSLTHNSLDNFEQSVSSRPLFKGVDQVSAAIWHGQPSNERNQKDVPTYRKVLSNGNGFLHHSQASNGQGLQAQQLKVVEGSSKPTGLDRQLSLHRQLSINSRQQNNVRSPSQSVGSHENGSDYSKDKKRVMLEKVSGNKYRSNDQIEEKISMGGADFVEPIISMIVSEPVLVVAKKLDEMNGQAIVGLKEGVRDIISNTGKQWQLSIFQKALNNRSDITLETLLKSNRIQLEILVALKTGLREFLQRNYDISTSDIAEIYLNLRCRNLTCRNLLPVDECDCKVCMQKNGFCSNCMCLVCSKFDMASNTCSWVGCDVCLHWCHADCALQESYIRNGRSASGPHGSREMQFHCVACEHPSEMFGFVKEVFQNCAKKWTAETFLKELEYVRKIFSASEDMRGKRLHDIAFLMLSRLGNKSDIQDVQNQIMGFFAESGSLKSDNPTVRSGKELFNRNQEGNNKIAGPSQEAAWLTPLYSEKAPQLEKASSFNSYINKLAGDPDLQRSAPKAPVFNELESIVRIKEAEAKMFQTRADDARREAEGLKRIAIAKAERIEEEYTSRISKLRLPEAEDMRNQKVEELQALERAHREYFNMKMRMEADIRDLMSKMEATKRNLAI